MIKPLQPYYQLVSISLRGKWGFWTKNEENFKKIANFY
jgi:hypothetical protein